jgi:hypothetical protein
MGFLRDMLRGRRAKRPVRGSQRPEQIAAARAAAMRHGQPSALAANGVATYGRRDPRDLPEAQKERLKALGLDPDKLAERREPAPPKDEVDAQLEQLGRLRDQGVLTPEEFEAQKRWVLGS